MIEFKFEDDGIYVMVKSGAGDIQAKIEYTKIPYMKGLPFEESEQLAAILSVVICRLTAELAMTANAQAMEKLRELAPLVVAPPEKKLIVPNGTV